jgi:hypothetical protein
MTNHLPTICRPANAIAKCSANPIVIRFQVHLPILVACLVCLPSEHPRFARLASLGQHFFAALGLQPINCYLRGGFLKIGSERYD